MRATIKSYLWPVIVGLLVGWVIDPGYLRHYVHLLYDQIYPVAEIYATPVKGVDNTISFMMSGVKHRDCTLDTLIAYDTALVGLERVRLNVERTDGSHSTQHDLGPFQGKIPWVLNPPIIGKLELFARHLCGDRHVMTPITIKP